VNSFSIFCSRKDQVEFVIKIDADTNDEKYVKKILQNNRFPFVIVKSKRGKGYLDMPRFCDEMIKASHGETLWMMSDDINIVFGDWANRLLSLGSLDGIYAAYVKYVSSPSKLAKGKSRLFGNACPIISRKLYDKLGCCSQKGVQIDIFIRGILSFLYTKYTGYNSKVKIFDDIVVVKTTKKSDRKRGGILEYEKSALTAPEYFELARKIDDTLSEKDMAETVDSIDSKRGDMRILVAGGAGFIASNLLCKLIQIPNFRIRSTIHNNPPQVNDGRINYYRCDLRNQADCLKACENIDCVVMCAANTSGAAVIEQNPLSHVTPNVIMNSLMLEAAYKCGVKKFIFLSSNTVYPPGNHAMKESDCDGDMFEKYYCVGWMKRFTEIMCNMYASKIRNPMNTIVIRPGNCYGEYDDFEYETAHVIPSLIRKAFERQDPFEVWGDGKDVKDFIYVGDLVDGIIKTITDINSCSTINIAGGESYSIKQILEYIFNTSEFHPNVEFNSNKPSMIPERYIDISYARSMGIVPQISLEEGISRTYKWYASHISAVK
jgi:GDP-L-fucose synthase